MVERAGAGAALADAEVEAETAPELKPEGEGIALLAAEGRMIEDEGTPDGPGMLDSGEDGASTLLAMEDDSKILLDGAVIRLDADGEREALSDRLDGRLATEVAAGDGKEYCVTELAMLRPGACEADML